MPPRSESSLKGARVWQYEFNAARNGRKTSHAAEIAYAFGDKKFASGLSLMPYRLNFNRSGDPNGKGLRRSPRYTPEIPRHASFDDAGVAPKPPLRAELCKLSERI